jgi:hypothetical protein
MPSETDEPEACGTCSVFCSEALPLHVGVHGARSHRLVQIQRGKHGTARWWRLAQVVFACVDDAALMRQFLKLNDCPDDF